MNLDENKRTSLLEALRHSPDDPKLLVQLADVEFKLGCVAEALDKYKKVAILGYDAFENKLNIVRCFFRLNKFKEANVAAEQIIEHGEGNAEFYSIICRIMIAEKRFDLAEEYYGYSVDMDDSFANSEIEYLLRYKGEKRPPSDLEIDDIDDQFDDLDLIDNEIEDKIIREIRSDCLFDDIDGLDELKKILDFKVIQQDLNPGLYKKFGQRKGGNILLFGPPGCGKERIAKALSCESGRPLYQVEKSELNSTEGRETKQLIDDVFQTVGLSENCLLLFNDLEQLGKKTNKEEWLEVMRHLQTSLKESRSKTPNIFSIITSVSPWELNQIPLNFDHFYFVPPPLLGERRSYLVNLLLQLPASDQINFHEVAKHTVGFTYHDLKQLVDKTAEQCLQQTLHAGQLQQITEANLLEVAGKMTSSAEEWLRLASIHGKFSRNSEVFKAIQEYVKKCD